MKSGRNVNVLLQVTPYNFYRIRKLAKKGQLNSHRL